MLEVDAAQLDLGRFEELLDRARAAEPAERALLLREALGLWRGPPFADLQFETFLQQEIHRLESLRLAALEERIAADLELRPTPSSSPRWRRSSASTRCGSACGRT